MAPTAQAAEIPDPQPRPGNKPQPIGNIPFIVLFTTTTLCVLLKAWTGYEGAIRLSQDEGPSAASFLEDENLDDVEPVVVDELSLQSHADARDWQQAQEDRHWKPTAPTAQDIADALPREDRARE
ncbi:hypothetical protein K488DRAFT_73665 [Vararia minispora EC-137]|uniref:Uncharacterized protein n=1 Tax=Vararia minispora EC-137 TaxID=1314806 RepID=A0ACB8QA51_9AGAM|nr:hypothetical protein K488DRAFT_73665 [Vararia minispora EC-137]